jgi:hypothetical protein
MNYLLIYLKFIDQIIKNHDKHRDRMQKVLKSFVPKVLPQPWMPPTNNVRFTFSAVIQHGQSMIVLFLSRPIEFVTLNTILGVIYGLK